MDDHDNLQNCTPLTIEYFNKFHQESNVRQHYVTIAYGVICAVGIIANVVLMTSLLGGGSRGVTYKTPSTILIMNLAIADMLLLLTLPFAIVHRLRDRWIFGEIACKLEEGIKFLNYYGSVFFITAMAIDRYICLCRPSAHDRRLVRKKLWMVSGGIWLLSLVFVLPLMVFAEVDAYGFCTIVFPGSYQTNLSDEAQQDNDTLCLENILNYEYANYDAYVTDYDPRALAYGVEEDMSCRHPSIYSMHVWLVCNFLIGFVIPFIIISVSYAKIVMLKSTLFPANHEECASPTGSAKEPTVREQFVLQERENDGRKSLKRNHKAKIIMGILVPCLILAFAICWLPYHAWHLAQITGVLPGVDTNVCNLIRDVTFCMAFFNSALNPILNSFFLFNFKERLIRSSNWLKKLPTKKMRNKTKTRGALSSKDKSFETSAHDVTQLTTGLSTNDESKTIKSVKL